MVSLNIKQEQKNIKYIWLYKKLKEELFGLDKEEEEEKLKWIGNIMLFWSEWQQEQINSKFVI